ncbi:2,3-bisphosphoglycerate-independent phosphoglycerate mutase [Kiloniella sp. b19]|uniref:2,3-bisphosphoglycerate-independent phosphoglycerate mutase n=1 Tax=Kiloniella sp. GXU_MW_B19 TaxID=3141326 RepID=UPI0031DCC4CB
MSDVTITSSPLPFTRKKSSRPVLLCILDGWGDRQKTTDNAITEASTPLMDRLGESLPSALLKTCGPDVGLPEGQMGNSEVGHMNIGAGRVVMQDLPRINAAMKDGSFQKTPALLQTIETLKENGGAAHVLGLLSRGGVHGHMDHVLSLISTIREAGIPVRVHAILDGRDTAPQAALDDVTAFEKALGNGTGAQASIVSLSGRYFAMDRDKRWERVQKAFDAMCNAKAPRVRSATDAIRDSYSAGVYDEFVEPVALEGHEGMQEGDALIMTNFRTDRAREILDAFLLPDFDGFDVTSRPVFSSALGMVRYSDALEAHMGCLFPPQTLDNGLGVVASQAGLSQFRIAETEKYPHVTYFFNGGEEELLPGETRCLVPSPKVATYDLQPEMSAHTVTEQLVAAIESGDYDLLICNYANCDMVGHTGSLEAAMQAAGTVDECLQKVTAAMETAGGSLIITADHGNAEQMLDAETGQPHTAHTLNPVPVLLFNGPDNCRTLGNGRLADLAPSILELLHLEQPAEMTGLSILNREL